MPLNYAFGRFVLGSLCVGDLVQLVLSSVRVAGFSLLHTANQEQNDQSHNSTA